MNDRNGKRGLPSKGVAVLAAVSVGLMILATLSCARGGREIGPGDLERGRNALQPFKKRLMGALTTALADGEEKAILACKTEAPRIGRELSSDGAEIGRTSHRLRNRANAPRPWMEPLLEAYRAGGETEPRAVPLGDSRYGYVEPIFVGSLCLTCHGEKVAPSLKEKIEELYPDDNAIGFQAREFRGMFWVTLPLDR